MARGRLPSFLRQNSVLCGRVPFCLPLVHGPCGRSWSSACDGLAVKTHWESTACGRTLGKLGIPSGLGWILLLELSMGPGPEEESSSQFSQQPDVACGMYLALVGAWR